MVIEAVCIMKGVKPKKVAGEKVCCCNNFPECSDMLKNGCKNSKICEKRFYGGGIPPKM